VPRCQLAGALSIFRTVDGNYLGRVLLVAVSLLGLALVVLAYALRKVSGSPSPASLHARFQSVAAASADLDDAAEELRAAVDGRTDR